MLTLKNVLPSGSEDVLEVRRVSLGKTVNPDANTSDDQFIPVVWGEHPDGSTIPFTDGTVYVMNENGKTVANYSLRWPGPHAAETIRN